ncbi:MAG: class I SAM-dependent methyltransferase [candidate division Zixibacteria bacterium]
MKKKNADWWEEFFDDFRPVFDSVPVKATNAVVRFAIKKLNLKSGNHVLDCPCGIGRATITLARKGMKITGVDFYQGYLDELDKKAAAKKLRIKTECCDMRRINYENKFHAVINLWTSFGYFEKESENLLVLRKFYKALKPGGRLLIQTINRDFIIADFKESEWLRISHGYVLIENKFDFRRSLIHGTWHFVKDGDESSQPMRIRAYSYHELVNMFEQVGFNDVEGYGSVEGEKISEKNRGNLIIGTKPRRKK